MGLFKSKEEREAERKQRELENKRIADAVRESEMTRILKLFLLEKFGDLNTEDVQMLRQLAAGGGRAGYLMDVRGEGILFTLINRKGEALDKWAITFDALGYENLPWVGVTVLKEELMSTLQDISHLMVLDTGFFMYDKNRSKQSW